MAITRGDIMSLMRKAIKVGQSRTSFLKDMKAAKTTYIQREMIADWRFLKDEHEKTGALSELRRNAYPKDKHIITTKWEIGAEYMYVVKVGMQLKPDEPITTRQVSIVTDKRLSPTMIEQAVTEKWSEWTVSAPEPLVTIEPWTVYRTTI